MEKFPERKLPVGLGQEELAKRRETLPAVEVANKVIWVNDNFPELPFKIEQGKPTDLGLFLTPEIQAGQEIYNLETLKLHSRTAILGRVIFQDRQGRLYRDIDLKGVGFTVRATSDPDSLGKVVPVQTTANSEAQTRGIVDKPYAWSDKDAAAIFLRAGISTYQILAITELEEIIDAQGNKISIAEAKARQLIKTTDKPVVEIRAFGTRARIGDLENEAEGVAARLFEDARLLVSQSLGLPEESFSGTEYARWFVNEIAHGVARMHAAGLVHGYLNSHNITLDAKIVDLDSVEKTEEAGSNKSYIKDRENVRAALYALFSKINSTELKVSELLKQFEDEYEIEFAKIKNTNRSDS